MTPAAIAGHRPGDGRIGPPPVSPPPVSTVASSPPASSTPASVVMIMVAIRVTMAVADRLSSAVYQRHMSGHPLTAAAVADDLGVAWLNGLPVGVVVDGAAHPGVGLNQLPFVAVAEDGV